MTRLGTVLVAAGSAGAAAGTLHAIVNTALLRRPAADPRPPTGRVSVLLPVRDEAHRVEPCVRALLRQTAGDRMEVLVLDDGSSDGTAAAVRRAAGGDPRLSVLAGPPPPAGWLGKPHACQRLADAADPASDVLVFVDADVVLAPQAVAAAVHLLDTAGLDLVCPYPRQLAGTPAERLVQPLLQWSWLTFLPLRWAERSRRPSLTAANGQFLAVRRAAYRRAGGHAAVRGEVLDDLALLRAIKRAGGRGGVADGTGLATCRMYRGWSDLRDGYSKSLWSAFRSPARAAAVAVLLCWFYLVPAVAAVRGSRLGLAGYAAAVIGRVVAGRASGARVVPDALAHPASVATACLLTARSWRAHRRGAVTWKGRVLP
jgi:glycosyltransferase involved in cell wall biosynthesis